MTMFSSLLVCWFVCLSSTRTDGGGDLSRRATLTFLLTVKIRSRNMLNPLIATLKPQSNGPSYSNTVIDTLTVDGWAVTFGTARRGLGSPPRLLAVPNVTAHPLTASVPTSHYSMWHYNYQCPLKG